MPNILQSKKISLGRLKFNSLWEYKIYKKILKILPSYCRPIRINQKIEGYRFELDIFIPKLKLAFELQGPLHFHNLKVINRDLIKSNICRHLKVHIIYLFFNKYYNNTFFKTIITTYLNKYMPTIIKTHITTMASHGDNVSTRDTQEDIPIDDNTSKYSQYEDSHSETSSTQGDIPNDDNTSKYCQHEDSVHSTKLEDSQSEDGSEHSLELSDTSDTPREKPKRISNKIDREQLKKYKENLSKHYDYIKSIKTEIYQPISEAIQVFKNQCPGINIQDSSLKRHVIKHYTDILDCKKVYNRWMVSGERLREIEFDLLKYRKGV